MPSVVQFHFLATFLSPFCGLGVRLCLGFESKKSVDPIPVSGVHPWFHGPRVRCLFSKVYVRSRILFSPPPSGPYALRLPAFHPGGMEPGRGGLVSAPAPESGRCPGLARCRRSAGQLSVRWLVPPCSEASWSAATISTLITIGLPAGLSKSAARSRSSCPPAVRISIRSR